MVEKYGVCKRYDLCFMFEHCFVSEKCTSTCFAKPKDGGKLTGSTHYARHLLLQIALSEAKQTTQSNGDRHLH